MIKSLKHNLTRLIDFSGRETRSQFWPYAGAVLVAVFVVMGGSMGFQVNRTFAAMETYAAEHPEDVTVVRTPTSTSMSINADADLPPELIPDFQAILAPVMVSVVIAVLLLASPVVRRLHDRNRSFWWGVPPPILLMTGFSGMMALFGTIGTSSEDEFFALFPMIFINNVAYIASLIVLVIQLSGSGSPQANRFGPVQG